MRGASSPSATVDFTASAAAGSAPLLVTFTPVFAGGAMAHEWTFGDGGTSAETTPRHIYLAVGALAVTLR